MTNLTHVNETKLAGVVCVEARLPNGTTATLMIRNAVLTETTRRQDIYSQWELSPVLSPIIEHQLVLSGEAVVDPTQQSLDDLVWAIYSGKNIDDVEAAHDAALAKVYA